MNDKKTLYHFDNYYIHKPLTFNSMLFYQIGRKFSNKGDLVPNHLHEKLFELTIVTSGSATLITNGEKVKVRQGDIYLSFPYEIHGIRSDQTDRFEYDFFAFYPTDKTLESEFEKIIITNRSPQSRTFQDENVSSLVSLALNEFPLKSENSSLLDGLFTAILTYVLRNFTAKQKQRRVSNAEITCMQIMSYIDSHLFTLNNLNELTEEFPYNYSYLSALFNKTTGKSLAQYFRRRKLETAKVLIVEGRKFFEIAELLGYSTQFAFTKAFTAEYGVSPTAYKKLKTK